VNLPGAVLFGPAGIRCHLDFVWSLIPKRPSSPIGFLALIREGVAALIANQQDMRLVGEASNGRNRIVPVAPAGRYFDGLANARDEWDRCPDCGSERISRGADHCADDLRGRRIVQAGDESRRASYILKGNVRNDLWTRFGLFEPEKSSFMRRSARNSPAMQLMTL
jgi:hypothetical protein